jgi:hypothetical protein
MTRSPHHADIVLRPPTTGAWAGRTSLSGGLGALREEIAQSRHDPARRRGALFASVWLDGIEGAYPPSEPVALPPSWGTTPGGREDFYFDFPGWPAQPPPAPCWVAPLPLPFVLPAVENRCPIDALAPWWDTIVLPEQRDAPPVASSPAGKHVWLGPWAQGESRWGWRSDVPTDLGTADVAGFDVVDGCVDAWSRRTLTLARVSGPGLVGSLVPGYAELRELASQASERTISTVFGCRIDFAFVSAVAFTMKFNTKAPILGAFGGKQIQQLLQQRGYGESTRFEIGIEFSDGWRPYRARLIGEHVPIERETEPLQFATWLARRIAYHRLNGLPYITDQDRTILDRVLNTDDPFGFTERRASTSLWQSLRVELPAHRPISVELAP